MSSIHIPYSTIIVTPPGNNLIAQNTVLLSSLACSLGPLGRFARPDLGALPFSIEVRTQSHLELSSSLRLDGKEEKGWRETGGGERTFADDYDYVCYGKVYRFDEGVKGTERV